MFIENGLSSAHAFAPGNLDKVADIIADALLDACLELDPRAHIEVNSLINAQSVRIDGKFATSKGREAAKLEPDQTLSIVRDVLQQAGYDREGSGIDVDALQLEDFLIQGHEPRKKVRQEYGLESYAPAEVVGYATSETRELLPAPLFFARLLMLEYYRLMKQTPWLMPDARGHFRFRYENGVPVAIHSIELRCQHAKDVSERQLRDLVVKQIVREIIPSDVLTRDMRLTINSAGPYFVETAHKGHGASGRQCVNDTYGSAAPFGGMSLSGKGPTFIERSGAYMARFLAKQVVARGWAQRCLVRIEYGGKNFDPYGFRVSTEDRNEARNLEIAAALRREFDLNPHSIISMLELDRPIYRLLGSFGHSGRDRRDFRWESVNNKVPHSVPELFTHRSPENSKDLPKKVKSKDPINWLYPYFFFELPQGYVRKEIAIEKGEPKVTIFPETVVSHPNPYGLDGLLSRECFLSLCHALQAASEENNLDLILMETELRALRFLPKKESQNLETPSEEKVKKGEENPEHTHKKLDPNPDLH